MDVCFLCYPLVIMYGVAHGTRPFLCGTKRWAGRSGRLLCGVMCGAMCGVMYGVMCGVMCGVICGMLYVVCYMWCVICGVLLWCVICVVLYMLCYVLYMLCFVLCVLCYVVGGMRRVRVCVRACVRACVCVCVCVCVLAANSFTSRPVPEVHYLLATMHIRQVCLC